MSVTTINKSVSASADDARNINGNGAASINAQTTHLGKLGTADYWNGFRWTGVNIPQGETILSAKIDLFSAQVANGSLAKIILYGEANNNALTYNTTAGNKPENRPRTTASVTQDLNPAAWTAGLGFGVEQIDVTAIVQEIVNRTGWVSGNALAIVAHDNGSSDDNYVAYSTYDRDTGRGAKLTVVYGTATPPAVPTGVSVTNDNEYRNRISWTDPNSDATSFTVQRKTGSGGTYATIATTTSPYFMDITAAAGETYYYRVSTTNLGGTSAYSTESSVTVMTGTGRWSSKIGAWFYPDSIRSPETEFEDGRTIHLLKPEYLTVSTAGVITQLTASSERPYAYSTANLNQVKAASEEQYITVSGTYNNFKQIFDDSTKRANAISSMVAFIETTNVTGLELDWEQFGDWTATHWTNFKSLCADLKTALNANGRKLMVCGPPISNTTEAGYYQWKYEEIISVVDVVTVMAYDYQYDYGGGVPVAPTDWVKANADWIIPRVGFANIDKLSFGMNSYGYQAASGSYSIIIRTYTENYNKPGFGTAVKHADADEMFWTDAGTVYSYVSPANMDAKRKVLEDKGIKHISVWHLGGNNWFTPTRAEIDGPSTPVDPTDPGDGPTIPSGPGIFRWNGSEWVADIVAAGEGGGITLPIAISDVTSLQAALDGKAATSHTHTIANVTDLQDILDGKAAATHTHTIANITGLQDALDDKQESSVITANGMGVVVHGATAGTARPTGFAQIMWIGTVTPTNATTNDIWYNG